MRASTISAAPSLSPDITPLLSDSSLPTIPSTLSPPNPDAMVAPGPFQHQFLVQFWYLVCNGL